MAEIEFRDVTKRYEDGFEAVKHMSLDIKDGEFMILVGPSGCGKAHPRLQDRLGTTMVYVTHDQTEALTLGDRVAVMRAGELQQVDTPKVLYEEPVNLFVAGFIGSPAMNFFPATVEGGRVRFALGEFELPERARGASGQVILGTRPEHFEDAALMGGKPGFVFEADV